MGNGKMHRDLIRNQFENWSLRRYRNLRFVSNWI